ncbi:hypothetical protein ACEPAI_8812 [Sanghuangporus weigelae]
MSVTMPRMRDALTTGSAPTASAGFAEMQKQLDANGVDSEPGASATRLEFCLFTAMYASRSRSGHASHGSTDSYESASLKVGDAKPTAISIPTPSPSPNTPVQSLPFLLSISLPSPESLSASLRLSLPPPSGASSDPAHKANDSEAFSSPKQRRQQQKRKHISLNHPSHPRTNPAHIPRPRNAFILFRSWALSSGLLSSSPSSASSPSRSNSNFVKTKGTGPGSKKNSTKCTTTSRASAPLQQNEASREIAKIWKRVDESTRGMFEEMAREEKRRHREMYPDYRYAPRKVQQQELSTEKYQIPSRVEKKIDVRNCVGKVVKNTGSRKRPVGAVATKKGDKKRRRRARAPLTPETTPEPSSPSPTPTPPPETETESEDVEYTRAGRDMHIGVDVDMDVDSDVGDADGDDGDEDSEKEEEEEELPLSKSIDVRTVSGNRVHSDRNFKSKSGKSPHPVFTYPSPFSPSPLLSVFYRTSSKSSGTSSPSRATGLIENKKHILDGAEIENKTVTFEKTVRSRATINQAYVPLLASTTYYAPTFVHVDRTCRVPDGPSSPSSRNPNASSSSAQTSSASENAVEDTLVNVPADLDSEHDASNHNDFNELEGFSFSFSLDSDKSGSVSGSLYEDEFGFVRFRRSEEEEEQELIRRALKPYAPLWHPNSTTKLSSSSSLTRIESSSSMVGKREGLAGLSIAQMCMMDLDML